MPLWGWNSLGKSAHTTDLVCHARSIVWNTRPICMTCFSVICQGQGSLKHSRLRSCQSRIQCLSALEPRTWTSKSAFGSVLRNWGALRSALKGSGKNSRGSTFGGFLVLTSLEGRETLIREEKTNININFFGPDFPQTFLTLEPGCPGVKTFLPITRAAGKRTFWCGRPRFSARTSMTRRVLAQNFPQKSLHWFLAPNSPRCWGPSSTTWRRKIKIGKFDLLSLCILWRYVHIDVHIVRHSLSRAIGSTTIGSILFQLLQDILFVTLLAPQRPQTPQIIKVTKKWLKSDF